MAARNWPSGLWQEASSTIPSDTESINPLPQARQSTRMMAIFGSFLGFGKGIPVTMTLTVLASTLGIGLAIGLLQYFIQRPKPAVQ